MCQVHQIINKLGKLRYLFVTLEKKAEQTKKQTNKTTKNSVANMHILEHSLSALFWDIN